MPQRENRLSALDSTVFVCMMYDDGRHKERIECKQDGRHSIDYHNLSGLSD